MMRNLGFLLAFITLASVIPVQGQTIRDDFKDPVLPQHWIIGPAQHQRDDSKWSLTKHPGYLTIMTQRSDIHQDSNNPRNFFLREVPYDDYQITTRLIFSPRRNFEQAGLIIWGGPDDYVRLSSLWAAGNRLEAAIEVNGVFSSQQMPNPQGDDIHLALRKEGRQHSFWYSADGINWEQMGSSVYCTHQDPLVGFFAISPVSGRTIPAQFQYFAIEKIKITKLSFNSS